MKPMKPLRPPVEFYATSTRLAQAFRSAAKRNKHLAEEAKLFLFNAAKSSHSNNSIEWKMVVLSHADDEPFPLANARIEKVFSTAFHVLFTEPGTHPDQVVQWMRATNIRSENRLHVVKVESLEGLQLSQLLGRVCVALRPEGNRGSIVDAYSVGGHLLVRGLRHRMLHIPIDSIAALKGQPGAVVRNFTIDPDGSFLYWPDLDVHLGWNQLLQAVDPLEYQKAQQRTTGFNERYGAAIRKTRDAAGIVQSKVEGLTERQLRRIERGECRATSTALNALAKAHGLELNAYMEKLAKAMN